MRPSNRLIGIAFGVVLIASVVAWVAYDRSADEGRPATETPSPAEHSVDSNPAASVPQNGLGAPTAAERLEGGPRLARLPSAPAPIAPIKAAAAGLPRTSPLSEHFEELAERADAGDTSAACRLAWDLDLCNKVTSLPEAQQYWVDSAASTDPGSADEAATLQLLQRVGTWAARGGEICRSMSPEQLGQGAQRMLQAAMLGHPVSMARFAMAPPFGQRLTLGDGELIMLHRQYALDFLERATAAGEPTALFGLYRAHSRGHVTTSYGDLAIRRDPVRALAAAIVLRGIADPQTAFEIDQVQGNLESELSQAQVRQARRLADAMGKPFEHQPVRDFASGIFGPDVGETCVDPE